MAIVDNFLFMENVKIIANISYFRVILIIESYFGGMMYGWHFYIMPHQT